MVGCSKEGKDDVILINDTTNTHEHQQGIRYLAVINVLQPAWMEILD